MSEAAGSFQSLLLKRARLPDLTGEGAKDAPQGDLKPPKSRYGIPNIAWRVVPALLVGAFLFAVWQMAVSITKVSPTVLPSPIRVITMGWANRSELWQNALPTLEETLIGIGATVVAASAVAIACDFSSFLRRAIYPALVASQTIPIIVIAPLMVIWFGFGLLPKILVIILINFFAITVALTAGFDATEPEAADLLRSMGATRWQQFVKVRLPTALPYFFTGLRISITWSVTAAIFGEWVGALNGLGIYMQLAKNNFRTDLVLAAVLVTAAMSLALFAAVHLLQRLCIPWYFKLKESSRH